MGKSEGCPKCGEKITGHMVRTNSAAFHSSKLIKFLLFHATVFAVFCDQNGILLFFDKSDWFWRKKSNNKQTNKLKFCPMREKSWENPDSYFWNWLLDMDEQKKQLRTKNISHDRVFWNQKFTSVSFVTLNFQNALLVYWLIRTYLSHVNPILFKFIQLYSILSSSIQFDPILTSFFTQFLECFTCVACGKDLSHDEFVLDEQKTIYCTEDWAKKKAYRCVTCKRAIVPTEGQTKAPRLRALGKDYHPDCFKCEVFNIQHFLCKFGMKPHMHLKYEFYKYYFFSELLNISWPFLSSLLGGFAVALLLHPTKSDDKNGQEMFNWSEVPSEKK